MTFDFAMKLLAVGIYDLPRFGGRSSYAAMVAAR